MRIPPEGADVYSVRNFASRHPHRVVHGWRCRRQEPDSPDCAETFTFDTQTGRAYVALALW